MFLLANYKFLIMCLLTVCLIFNSIIAIAEDTSEQQKIIDHVAILLLQENFKKLNELAHEYRVKKSLLTDGSWKLNAFYLGISQLADVYNRNELFWNALENKTRKWIKNFSKSPAAHIAHAIVLSRHGWMLRGTNNPEDWLAFFEYNKAALQHLEKHKAISIVDPTWYEEMAWITASLGGDENKILQLIDQGLQQEPSFRHLELNAILRAIGDPRFDPMNASILDYTTDDLVKKIERFNTYLPLILQPHLPRAQENLEALMRNYPTYFAHWLAMGCKALKSEQVIRSINELNDPQLHHIWHILSDSQCKQ